MQSSSDLPPNDEREQWIQHNVAKLRQALSDPVLRREISDFLNGESERYGTDDENAEAP